MSLLKAPCELYIGILNPGLKNVIAINFLDQMNFSTGRPTSDAILIFLKKTSGNNLQVKITLRNT